MNGNKVTRENILSYIDDAAKWLVVSLMYIAVSLMFFVWLFVGLPFIIAAFLILTIISTVAAFYIAIEGRSPKNRYRQVYELLLVWPQGVRRIFSILDVMDEPEPEPSTEEQPPLTEKQIAIRVFVTIGLMLLLYSLFFSQINGFIQEMTSFISGYIDHGDVASKIKNLSCDICSGGIAIPR